MKTIRVYIDSRDSKTRQIVEAKLIEDKETTVIVELPDGRVIRRKKKRDLPQEQK